MRGLAYMAWNKLLQLILGSGLLVGQSLNAPPWHPVRIKTEDLLSYQCAHSVATLVMGEDQVGPLFSQGTLVFTSLQANDTSRILIVNAGYGNFVIPLANSGVNRLRFTLPSAPTGIPRQYYISYLHGGSLRSRYFEYSEVVAPAAHDELDYVQIQPSYADYLLPHLDYAIHETADAILQGITDGRIERKKLSGHSVENCEYVARQSPNLAAYLQRSLDTLDLLVMGPKPPQLRMPASAKK